ncbi:MAG: cyclic nucleotide-binding domain-containing protein [Bdellovibrionales bacterium]|nr:cyclic nucleotide-binding domain-containing protein [Bdellovibrionales bacterium]
MILERQTKLEYRPIQMSSIDLKAARAEGALLGRINAQGITLTSQLSRFLELMHENKSLFDVVMYHFDKNIRMSFSGLKQLLVFLVEENHIEDKAFQEQFTIARESIDVQNVVENIKVKVSGQELGIDMADAHRQVSELPFFRSLNFDILDLFFANSKIARADAKVAVCTAGQSHRTLYVMLSGSATAYKKTATGKKRKTASFYPGAIFGETGFFLGEARGEDVITDEDSVLMQVKYNPEAFDPIFQEAQSREISNRLWLVQAMLQSQFFRSIPSDNFHEVVVSGQIKKYPAGQTLYRESDKGATCYILVKGTVEVSREGKKLTELLPGEIIGETGLLINGGKCTETITTTSEVMVLEMSDREFFELLAANFTLGVELEKIAEGRLKTET